MSDDKPMDRRRFFREGLRSLLDNVGKATNPLQRALKEFESASGASPTPPSTAGRSQAPSTGRPSGSATYQPPSRGGSATSGKGPGGKPSNTSLRILRPPGAKEEEDFVATCSTCGNCVSACPVQAIQLDPERGEGVPFIVAGEQPCTMCDGLLCMYNCPSGAITAAPIGLIDMGTAGWHEDRCVRSQGTECTMCVDRCPIGPRAIELLDGKIAVHPDGCTGCGVCEHDCPTTPKSIIVIPAAMREE